MHMIGHSMALDQFNPLLLAQLPDDPSDTASELPIDDPASVLRHKNNVILAVPADVRLALPVSHENLLPSERGGSLWTCSGNTGHIREEISSHRPITWKHKTIKADISKPAKRSCSPRAVCCGVRRSQARCWTLIHWVSSSSINSSCGEAN